MSKLLKFIDQLEEGVITLLLGSMVLITFTQVIARYMFNTGWGSALEITQVLFAWLILFGMSYGIKISSHLGVDILVRKFPPKVFKFFAVIGALTCVLYGITFLWADWVHWFGVEGNKGGALYYWQKIYKVGIGMESIVLPEWLFGADERMPRWVAYIILPIGLVLFIFRCLQALFAIATDQREMIIASHEAEELLEKNKKESE